MVVLSEKQRITAVRYDSIPNILYIGWSLEFTNWEMPCPEKKISGVGG